MDIVYSLIFEHSVKYSIPKVLNELYERKDTKAFLSKVSDRTLSVASLQSIITKQSLSIENLNLMLGTVETLYAETADLVQEKYSVQDYFRLLDSIKILILTKILLDDDLEVGEKVGEVARFFPLEEDEEESEEETDKHQLTSALTRSSERKMQFRRCCLFYLSGEQDQSEFVTSEQYRRIQTKMLKSAYRFLNIMKKNLPRTFLDEVCDKRGEERKSMKFPNPVVKEILLDLLGSSTDLSESNLLKMIGLMKKYILFDPADILSSEESLSQDSTSSNPWRSPTSSISLSPKCTSPDYRGRVYTIKRSRKPAGSRDNPLLSRSKSLPGIRRQILHSPIMKKVKVVLNRVNLKPGQRVPVPFVSTAPRNVMTVTADVHRVPERVPSHGGVAPPGVDLVHAREPVICGPPDSEGQIERISSAKKVKTLNASSNSVTASGSSAGLHKKQSKDLAGNSSCSSKITPVTSCRSSAALGQKQSGNLVGTTSSSSRTKPVQSNWVLSSSAELPQKRSGDPIEIASSAKIRRVMKDRSFPAEKSSNCAKGIVRNGLKWTSKSSSIPDRRVTSLGLQKTVCLSRSESPNGVKIKPVHPCDRYCPCRTDSETEETSVPAADGECDSITSNSSSDKSSVFGSSPNDGMSSASDSLIDATWSPPVGLSKETFVKVKSSERIKVLFDIERERSSDQSRTTAKRTSSAVIDKVQNENCVDKLKSPELLRNSKLPQLSKSSDEGTSSAMGKRARSGEQSKTTAKRTSSTVIDKVQSKNCVNKQKSPELLKLLQSSESSDENSKLPVVKKRLFIDMCEWGEMPHEAHPGPTLRNGLTADSNMLHDLNRKPHSSSASVRLKRSLKSQRRHTLPEMSPKKQPEFIRKSVDSRSVSRVSSARTSSKLAPVQRTLSRYSLEGSAKTSFSSKPRSCPKSTEQTVSSPVQSKTRRSLPSQCRDTSSKTKIQLKTRDGSRRVRNRLRKQNGLKQGKSTLSSPSENSKIELQEHFSQKYTSSPKKRRFFLYNRDPDPDWSIDLERVANPNPRKLQNKQFQEEINKLNKSRQVTKNARKFLLRKNRKVKKSRLRLETLVTKNKRIRKKQARKASRNSAGNDLTRRCSAKKYTHMKTPSDHGLKSRTRQKIVENRQMDRPRFMSEAVAASEESENEASPQKVPDLGRFLKTPIVKPCILKLQRIDMK